MNKKPLQKTVFLTSVGVVLGAFSGTATEAQAQIKMEKCYGIVKAGKNDCRAADGSHNCASYSKTDASPYEWMSMPAGTCDKIVNATTIAPKKKTEEEY